MNRDEFKELYVNNTQRQKIYSEFEDYLNTVKEYLFPYVLLVYGSFITEKEIPNDMDVLLHGFVKNEKVASFNINMMKSKGLIHVKLEVSALKQETVTKSNEELIKWFEEGKKNKTKAIKVGKYVQIDF
jgi:hypothetical protein